MRLAYFLAFMGALYAQPKYDLLLKGGRVIDPKNNIDRVMDVAIADGKIAQVSTGIDAALAKRVANVSGLVVAPGLIDLHTHLYVWREAGGEGIQADAFSFRTGVTTMVDAGSTGWQWFPDFRDRIIKRSKTRILAMLNIVGAGMGSKKEDDPAEMDAAAAIKMAKANPDIIVGFKAAHFVGPGWEAEENAVKAGEATGLPVMVDFGRTNQKRNINALFLDKLRPGDIYTHCFSGHRQELLDSGKLNPAMAAGRKRGIYFDIGHGGASFYWYVAVPAYAEHFAPDSISTDMHTGSMNAGMKDMTNVMSKILNLGSPIADVIRMSTATPAKEIHHPELGNLDVGAVADVAVLRVEKRAFGLVDSAGARKAADQRIVCELTVRAGKVVWDLNGIAADDWKTFKYKKTWP